MEMQEHENFEGSEVLSSHEVSLSLANFELKINALTKNNELAAITDEKGSPRTEEIKEKVNVEPMLADAIIGFFQERGVQASFELIPDSQEAERTFSLSSDGFNEAIQERKILVALKPEENAYSIDGLDGYINDFRKEHAFDSKYNPEVELE